MDARPIEQWEQILKGLTSFEAAKRIFGDIYYYRPVHDKWGFPKNTNQVNQDYRQLQNALEAYRKIT